MSDLQLITIAFFAIGLIAFFFGEPFAITLLLGWLTYQWVGDQPDLPYAIVQAGLAWGVLITLNWVFNEAIRAHRRLTWRKRYAEYQAARAKFERAGLDWDYGMARAGMRHQAKEQMYWNVGLGNQSDRINYFSERGDY